AMSTGHDGSMGTLHANNPRDALNRLEMLAGFSGYMGSEQTLRQQVASAVDMIAHMGRLPSGERKVLYIHELTGMADGHYTMQELFSYEPATDRFVRRDIKPRNPKLDRVAEPVTEYEETSLFGGPRYV